MTESQKGIMPQTEGHEDIDWPIQALEVREADDQAKKQEKEGEG